MNGMEILLQDTEQNPAMHDLIEQIFNTCMEGNNFATWLCARSVERTDLEEGHAHWAGVHGRSRVLAG